MKTHPMIIFVFIQLVNSKSENLTTNQKLQLEYHSVSFCSCDMTQNHCDMPCCICDPDCPEEMKGLAICTENIASQNENPFLVDIWNTSSYLGHFYKNPTKINSLADIYIHTQTPNSNAEVNFNEQMRSSGSPIRTVMGDFLTLPQNTFRGECANDVPIQYLREMDSACTTVFYPDHCLEGSKNLYDTLSYINPSNKLRLTLGSEFDDEVPIFIEYYLSKDPSPYIGEKTFPDESTTIFRTSNHTPMNSKKHIMKVELNFCTNVVLEVIYDFSWRASNITSIKVQILLGNIPLLSDNQIIHQFFQVNFDQKFKEISSKKPYIQFGHPIPIRNHRGDDYLNTFSNGASCQGSGMERVLFGENTFTSCQLTVSKNDFNNCSLLRETIESTIVNHLLFTSLLKENNNQELPELIDSEDYFLNVTFGARNLAFKDINKTIVPVCELPIHFYVDILYLKGSYPYIIGVKLSVTNDILEWSKIQENIMKYEFFHSIHFQETSYNFKEENYSRFWRQQSVGYCSGGSCWNDIFFLLREVDDLRYRTQWILVLTPVTIFYLWATKTVIPW